MTEAAGPPAAARVAVGTEAEAKAAEAWVEAEREAVARAVKEVEDIPKTRGSLRADAKTKSQAATCRLPASLIHVNATG